MDTFVQKTFFNFSYKVLTETEIGLEKGLNFYLIQRNIIEPELRNDFNEF